MFDQTFVKDAENGNRPLSLVVSLLIEVAAVGVLIIVPLIYTAALPNTTWKSFLVAPHPPTAVPKLAQRISALQATRAPRVFTARTIFSPVAVPRQINPVRDIGAPPEIGTTDSGIQTGDSVGSVFPDAVTPTPAPPPLSAQPKPKPALPIRIGTGAAEAKLINKVIPPYPSLAKAARIQGTVEFTATISKEGNIENLQLVRGHPLLVAAARAAVLQWKYRPTLLNGQPVEVLTQIVVNFTLAQ
jgi:periplasmic protein TonB